MSLLEIVYWIGFGFSFFPMGFVCVMGLVYGHPRGLADLAEILAVGLLAMLAWPVMAVGALVLFLVPVYKKGMPVPPPVVCLACCEGRHIDCSQIVVSVLCDCECPP